MGAYDAKYRIDNIVNAIDAGENLPKEKLITRLYQASAAVAEYANGMEARVTEAAKMSAEYKGKHEVLNMLFIQRGYTLRWLWTTHMILILAVAILTGMLVKLHA